MTILALKLAFLEGKLTGTNEEFSNDTLDDINLQLFGPVEN